MSYGRVDICGGVDTHRDTHVAAVVDGAGRTLGSESFPADRVGYQRMVAWFGSAGHLVRVGVEGCGSYGAGLARYLCAAGIGVVEVNRPNRQLRRQRGGKSDSVDAEAAARAAASGQATSVPKSGVGPVECLRMLLVARRPAAKARTQAANQIHSVIVGAPEQVKCRLRGLNLRAQVRVCARWRPGPAQTTAAYAKKALRHLARRYQTLDTEIAQLDEDIRRLCAQANPALLAAPGVGPDTASVLLVAAGDNPDRMRTDPATQQYVTRRQGEGKNRKEIIRCLKRHIAREIYWLITNPPPTPNCAQLRSRRQHAGVTISQAARALGTRPARISELERGRDHNHHLATRYQDWLHTHYPAPPAS